MSTAHFTRAGLSFDYPADWEVTEEPGGSTSEFTVTVSSPQTAFWSAYVLDELDLDAVLAAALDAFEDSEDLDVYEVTDTVCQQPAVARDLDFVFNSVVAGAAIRIVNTETGSLLIMYQFHDKELDATGPILEAITKSVRYEFDETAW